MAASWVRHFLSQPEDEAWQQSILYRFSSSMIALKHILIMVTGLVWLIAPSNSVDEALSPFWSGAWSAGFFVFSLVAYIARLRRAWPIEAAATIVVALAVWLWAMVILVVTIAGDLGGLQTAYMLFAFASSMVGWAVTQIAWVRRRESEGARLQKQVAHYLAIEKEKAELREKGASDA